MVSTSAGGQRFSKVVTLMHLLTLSVHSCEMLIHKLAKPGCDLRKSISAHRDDDARDVCATGLHETPEVFANEFTQTTFAGSTDCQTF